MAERPTAELAAAVLTGDGDAIAECLALVEDTRPAALEAQRALVARLEAETPSSHHVVGITGPPGVGKSTLAGELIRHWIAREQGVGMVAVDPSSRRSGGALLGDRARLRFDAGERVFVRSMAARERLGGLAPATRAAVVVLRAAFEWTLVETVGVGQSEIDVATLADSVALVLQPGSGDALQFMKAGILEIPDVLVVHKWDLGELAEQTRADLEAMLSLSEQPAHGWRAPVVGASAKTGHGIGAVADALEAHRQQLVRDDQLARRRHEARTAWALELFESRYGSLGYERVDGRDAARRAVEATQGSALDAFSSLASRAGLES